MYLDTLVYVSSVDNRFSKREVAQEFLLTGIDIGTQVPNVNSRSKLRHLWEMRKIPCKIPIWCEKKKVKTVAGIQSELLKILYCSTNLWFVNELRNVLHVTKPTIRKAKKLNPTALRIEKSTASWQISKIHSWGGWPEPFLSEAVQVGELPRDNFATCVEKFPK